MRQFYASASALRPTLFPLFSSHARRSLVSAGQFFRFSSPTTTLPISMLSKAAIMPLCYSSMRVSTLHKGVQDGDEHESTLLHASSRQGVPIDFQEGRHTMASRLRNLGEDYAVKRDVLEAANFVHTTGDRVGRGKNSRSFNDALGVLESLLMRKSKGSQNNCVAVGRLLDRLGMRSVLERIRFVHIAGTKGKGTTATYTAALLKAYGFKVGLFTSPHLLDVRERMLVDNSLLSQHTFARYFFEFCARFEELKHSESESDRDYASNINYFSFLFLLSLHVFAAENVEVAVMEVGIGGRKDATNVIPSEVSVITAIGHDHMEVLGDTIQLILREKAAIMRPDVVCFASPQKDHPVARAGLEATARENCTPFIFLDDTIFPIKNWPRLAIGGDHAIEDSKLAFMAARQIAGIPPVLPLDEAERTVLRNKTFSGRSQIVPLGDSRDCVFYLDGAHTVESLEHATRWFLEASVTPSGSTQGGGRDDLGKGPRRVLLFFTLRDPHRILKTFMPFIANFCKVVIAQVYVTKPAVPRVTVGDTASAGTDGASGDDCYAKEDFLRDARERLVSTTGAWRELYREVPCLPCAEPFRSMDDILNLVLPAASSNEDASEPAHVFVCGSLYLVGNVLQLLGMDAVGG